MNIKKIIGTFMAVMGLGVAVAAPSMAQQQQFAVAAAGGTIAQQSTVFNYSGGPAGTFTTSAGSIFTGLSGGNVDQGATLTFTGLTASAMATTSGSSISQTLGLGTFTLKSASNVTLLSGSFGGGNILTADTSGSTASIITTVNSVVYDTTPYLTGSGLTNPGSFSISMTSVTPPPTIVGGYLSKFQAGGSANFSAQKPAGTPEPATLATFALGGLGLLGLIARKTRRTGGMAA